MILKNLKSTIWTDLVCMLFYAIVIKIIFSSYQYYMYLQGLKVNGSSFNLVIVPFFMVLLFVFVLMLTILIARLLLYFRKNKGVLSLLRILLILVVPCILFFNFAIEKPGYVYFTKGFSELIKKEVDTNKIRQWKNEIESEVTKMEAIDESIWTKSIKSLSPNHVWLETLDSNASIIRLEWGGPAGHWGLAVGPLGMEPPLSNLERFGNYIIPLENGSYVWHEVR